MPIATNDPSIISLIEQVVPELWAVYQFGSAGTSAERADSDLDIAFLSGRKIEPIATWDLAQRIASRLGCDVDLIDLGRASTVMAAQILTNGRRLWCLADNPCAAFEAHTLADYARLNEERRDLLASIAEHGKVHG